MTAPSTPGSVRQVRVRLLPWRPRWRVKDLPHGDPTDALDVMDDPVSAVIGLVLFVVVLPVVGFLVLGLLLFSLEVGLLLMLLPLVAIVQLVGLRPWYLGVTPTVGERVWVCAGGTPEMLAARRYYRSLRPRVPVR